MKALRLRRTRILARQPNPARRAPYERSRALRAARALFGPDSIAEGLWSLAALGLSTTVFALILRIAHIGDTEAYKAGLAGRPAVYLGAARSDASGADSRWLSADPEGARGR